jgi:predicted permease
MNDLRLAFRSLAKTPGFAALAIVILGLGLGVNVTLFTLVRGLLLAPPSGVTQPDRLVRFTRMTDASKSGSWSYPDYVFYRDENRTFSGIAALAGRQVVLADRGGDPVEATLAYVSGNYFEVLGIPFVSGRAFSAAEDVTPGAAPLVVLSQRFWETHLGGDPRAVGSTIALNGHPVTILGVVSREFRGLNAAEGVPDLWAPIMMIATLQPGDGGDRFRRVPGQTENWVQSIGRLRPGVSVAAARADLTELWRRLNETFPQWQRGTGVWVTEHFEFAPFVRDQLGATMRLLVLAAGAVLLVACANLALLLLARATARRKEMGVRLALGAGRRHVVWRLLAETLLLAAGGGVVGLLLAVWSADFAAGLLPVRAATGLGLDWVVFGFTAALACGTAMLCGLAPALIASRTSVVEDLKAGAPGSGRSPVRDLLVATQVTLSVALVASAGLFVRSLLHAQRVDLGFEYENRLLLTVSLQDHGYSEDAGIEFVGRAIERLAAIPGVRSATTTAMVALGGGKWTSDFEADGVTPPAGQSAFDGPTNAVGPGYFATLGIPLLAGRDFTLRDDRSSVPVAIVNESLARQVWGASSPIGRTIRRDDSVFTVIGLARDATYYELGEAPEGQIYYSELQLYRGGITFVIQAAGDAAALAPVVRRELHALDPNLAVSSVRSYDEILSDAAAPYRVTATLVSLFGVLALTLAGVGIYGMLSYVVVQGTREIAVRIALGAEAPQVAARVVRRSVRMTAAGIVAGLLLIWPASRLVQRFLFGIAPSDPLSLALAAGVLLAVAVAASAIPAWRAARVDPMEALRYE